MQWPGLQAPTDANAANAGRSASTKSCAALSKSADEVSIDNLSMPQLARHLDVGVTSIYWYFRRKDELLDAMTERVLLDYDLSVLSIEAGHLAWTPYAPMPTACAKMFTNESDYVRSHPDPRHPRYAGGSASRWRRSSSRWPHWWPPGSPPSRHSTPTRPFPCSSVAPLYCSACRAEQPMTSFPASTGNR